MESTEVPLGRFGTTHLPNVQDWVCAGRNICEDVSPKDLCQKKMHDGKYYLLKIDLYYNFIPVPGASSGRISLIVSYSTETVLMCTL